jgi:hypothetical protein
MTISATATPIGEAADAGGKLGGDPQLPALARHGVAPVELGFFLGLRPEEGDRDPVSEDVVATQPQLRFCFIRQVVPHLGQFLDQLVEGQLIPDVDEFLDASTHCDPPRSPGVKYLSRDFVRNV